MRGGRREAGWGAKAGYTSRFMLATLRDAVRGTTIDYTTAPIGRAVIMLAVPMVVEMAMESIFAVADVFWVAHLGADAVATVGLTESMMTHHLHRRRWACRSARPRSSRGASASRNPEARRTRPGSRSCSASRVSAAIAAARRAECARRCCALMGASDAGRRSPAAAFTRVMLGGNATVLLLFLLNAVFRGAGDAAIAMRVLILGNALNIVLGPCFIFGLGPFPELGVAGAAVATNIGRGTRRAVSARTRSTRGRGRVRLAAAASAARLRRDADRAAAVRPRHVPDPDRHGELHRPRPDPLGVRQRRARRLHHRHPR